MITSLNNYNGTYINNQDVSLDINNNEAHPISNLRRILCIIPARSGSKGIIHKNIRLFKEKPLIAWTIEQALSSKYKNIMKIVVSTDSEEYAKIAREYGAEVPFLRPCEISNDTSLDIDFIAHCVSYLNDNYNYNSDIILQLRPTSPLRKTIDIDNAIDYFIENRENYDSLRSVIEFEKSPYKMYNIKNQTLIPLFNTVDEIIEPINQCRQVLPKCYLHNGYIDIFNTELLHKNTISGTKILPFIMNKEDDIDIDNESDWIT